VVFRTSFQKKQFGSYHTNNDGILALTESTIICNTFYYRDPVNVKINYNIAQLTVNEIQVQQGKRMWTSQLGF